LLKHELARDRPTETKP